MLRNSQGFRCKKMKFYLFTIVKQKSTMLMYNLFGIFVKKRFSTRLFSSFELVCIDYPFVLTGGIMLILFKYAVEV